MKLTHLSHSGFSLELENTVLIFDWYEGELPEFEKKSDRAAVGHETSDSKDVYVFASHFHHDHYDPRIWELKKQFDKVHYILDSTCEIPQGTGNPAEGAEITVVCPDGKYQVGGQPGEDTPEGQPGEDTSTRGGQFDVVGPQDESNATGIYVETLESNDEGVAFYVEAEGKHIFHSGDLNVWYWGNRPVEDDIRSENFCRGQYSKLSGKHIDLAMIPLDPRLGTEAPRAIAAFMDCAGADHIIPMHYWDRQAETMEYVKDPRIAEYAPRMDFHDVVVVE